MSLAIFPKAFSIGFVPRVDTSNFNHAGPPIVLGDSGRNPDEQDPSAASKPAPANDGKGAGDEVDLSFNRETRFEMDHETKKVVVKVIDKKTHEEIKQIPNKQAQRLSQNIGQYLHKTFDGLA
ncbi:MAG: flagellar protein FlaG [Nitrospinae bacterium]|nr:flagellar protein FlaG [Nitrospinota bacterium]